MGDLTDFNAEPITRKNMVMFYILDTSGSMDGAKINILNNVMSEVADELVDVQGADSEIKIAVMTFDDDVHWITKEPISVEEFHWSPVETNCLTSLGAALTELDKKLSRRAFLKTPHQSFAPIVFLLSDGEPTDEYSKPLETLKQNKWFHYATKVAMAIGEDANVDVLSEFTGNRELVVRANNGAALNRLIKMVSVTSSQISSQSRNLDSSTDLTGDAAMEKDLEDRNKKLGDALQAGVRPEDTVDDDDW